MTTKTSKPCIVIRETKEGRTVCSEGQKPFIGTQFAAQELADFLKRLYNSKVYRVYSVTPLAAEDRVVEKFSGSSIDQSAGKVRTVTRRKK